MKTSFIAVVAFCLFAFTSVFAQKHVMEGVKVSWGDIHKTYSEGREFIGEEGESVYLVNEYYTYKGKIGVLAMGPMKHLYSIEKYDKKGNFQLSYDIPMRMDKAEVFYEFSLLFNDRLLLFTSQFSRQESTLYLQEMDKETLEFSGEKKELMRTKLPKGRNQSGYFYQLSPDQKRLAIFNSKPHKDIYINDMDVEVFDENMDLIWSRNFDYDTHQTLLDNKGDLYNLVFSEEDDYGWSVRKYTDSGGNLEKHEIDLGDLAAYRMRIELRENNGVVCTGLYTYKKEEEEEEESQSKKKKKRRSTVLEHSFTGVFYAVIDGDSESIVRSTTSEFYAEFLSEFSTEVGAPKSERLINYYLVDIFVREDGGAVFLAEQYYTVSNTSTTKSFNTSRTSTNTVHYTGSVLVGNISSSGELEWIRKVEKLWGASEIGNRISSQYLGDVRTMRNNAVYLIYNQTDEVKITKISETGEVDTETLQKVKPKDDRYSLSTKLSADVSDNQLWFNTDRGSKSKIGILEFD